MKELIPTAQFHVFLKIISIFILTLSCSTNTVNVIEHPVCFMGIVHPGDPNDKEKLQAIENFNRHKSKVIPKRNIASRPQDPNSKFKILVVYEEGTQNYIEIIKTILFNREPFSALVDNVEFQEVLGDKEKMDCKPYGRTTTCEGEEYLTKMRLKNKAHRVLALTARGWGGTGQGDIYTLGTLGMDPYVVVHEFYHTFNFDDEYIEALGDPDSRVYPGSQVYDRLESVCDKEIDVNVSANHFQVPTKIDKGREINKEHNISDWNKLFSKIPWKNYLKTSEPIFDSEKNVFGLPVSYANDRFGRHVSKNSEDTEIGLYRGGYCSLWRPSFIPFQKNTIMDSGYWVPRYYSEYIVQMIENEIGHDLNVNFENLGFKLMSDKSLVLPDGKSIKY